MSRESSFSMLSSDDLRDSCAGVGGTGESAGAGRSKFDCLRDAQLFKVSGGRRLVDDARCLLRGGVRVAMNDGSTQRGGQLVYEAMLKLKSRAENKSVTSLSLTLSLACRPSPTGIPPGFQRRSTNFSHNHNIM